MFEYHKSVTNLFRIPKTQIYCLGYATHSGKYLESFTMKLAFTTQCYTAVLKSLKRHWLNHLKIKDKTDKIHKANFSY
jgi:hypothetical protein